MKSNREKWNSIKREKWNFGEKGFCGFNKKSKTKMENVNSP
jgi:hypothetical protein